MLTRIAHRHRQWPASAAAVRALASGLVVATAALVVGILLAGIGDQFGAMAVVAVPLLGGVVVVALTRPWAAVLLVVAAIPAGFVVVPVAGLQLIEVAVLAAGGLTIVGRLASGEAPLPWPRLAWWPLGIIALGLVSTTSAPDLQLAAKQMALLAGGMLLLLTTVAVVSDTERLRATMVAFAAAGAGVSLHGVSGSGQLAARLGGLSVANRPTGIFTSPNQLGALAGIVVVIGVALLVGATRRSHRVVGIVAAVSGAAGLAVTLSRGAWLGTGVALLAFLVAVPSARRASLRWILPLSVVAALGGSVALPETGTQVQVVRDRLGTLTAAETSPYDNRTDIWAEAVRQIRDAPVTGQGPASFPVVSQRSVSEASFVGANHAHNSVLNIGAEFGLVGLALVAGFAVSLLTGLVRAMRRAGSSADRALLAGCGAALMVQVTHGLVDYTLRNAVLAMVTWLLTGMIVAAVEMRPR